MSRKFGLSENSTCRQSHGFAEPRLLIEVPMKSSLELRSIGKRAFMAMDTSRLSLSAKSLIWSDPVHPLETVGLFLSLRLLLLFLEDRASSSRSMFERRLISLIFAGRNRIILIRRELPLTSVASPAKPVA
jgi:hypothetical protein